jgi:hypothetical protein
MSREYRFRLLSLLNVCADRPERHRHIFLWAHICRSIGFKNLWVKAGDDIAGGESSLEIGSAVPDGRNPHRLTLGDRVEVVVGRSLMTAAFPASSTGRVAESARATDRPSQRVPSAADTRIPDILQSGQRSEAGHPGTVVANAG